jgi:hypothetical protein
MTVNMVMLPETQSGTKRPKPTTPKNDAFAIVLSTKPYKVWQFWGAYFNEICDKQRSKVENLAKYVHLQEVGTFQIIISVTKY